MDMVGKPFDIGTYEGEITALVDKYAPLGHSKETLTSDVKGFYQGAIERAQHQPVTIQTYTNIFVTRDVRKAMADKYGEPPRAEQREEKKDLSHNPKWLGLIGKLSRTA